MMGPLNLCNHCHWSLSRDTGAGDPQPMLAWAPLQDSVQSLIPACRDGQQEKRLRAYINCAKYKELTMHLHNPYQDL